MPGLTHRATPDDWVRVRDIRLESLLADPDAFGSTHAREVDRDEAGWRAWIAGGAVILGVLDGVDVGILGVAGHSLAGARGVYSVWVRPAGRGRGFGDALVRHGIEAGWGMGAERLILDVAVENAPAIALYERHGFVPTGETSTLPPPRTHIAEIEMGLERPMTQKPGG